MWIFLSGGMLMPALIPENVLRSARTPDIQEAVERGWELQVRGRVREHLEWFAETYMMPGTYSATYVVKDKDYQARFYTTRADFGDALALASLAMDYTKFKDTANRFPWGKKYHDLLIRVWSASAAIFGAGGFYGEYSKKDNPRGRKRGNPRKWGRYDRPVGSSFLYSDEDQMASDFSSVELTDEELEARFAEEHDVPMWATKKSVHDMTDAEFAASEDRF